MDMDLIKCVVVGDSFSGKTALLEAFTTGTPTRESDEYFPTVINHYEAATTVGESEITLALFDTSGTSGGIKLRKCLYPQTKALIVAFSVFDPMSFENVKTKWVPEIRTKCPGVPWVLVGTHADLRSDNAALALLRAQQSQGPVSMATAEATARDLQATAYVECSAASLTGVDRVFHEAAMAARNAELHKLQREYEKETQEAVFGGKPSGTSAFKTSFSSLINKRASSSASLGSRCSSTDSFHMPKKPRFMRPQKSKNARVSKDELKATIRFVPKEEGAKPLAPNVFENRESRRSNPPPERKKPPLKPKPAIPPRPVMPVHKVGNLPVYKFGNGDPKNKENGLEYMEPVRIKSTDAPIYAAIENDDSDYEN